MTNRDRFKTLKRDNYTCQYCGRKSPEVELQVDHIVPRSKGGKDELGNYLTSCRECNMGKFTKEVLNLEPTEENNLLIAAKLYRYWTEQINGDKGLKIEDIISALNAGLSPEKIKREMDRVKGNFLGFFMVTRQTA